MNLNLQISDKMESCLSELSTNSVVALLKLSSALRQIFSLQTGPDWSRLNKLFFSINF